MNKETNKNTCCGEDDEGMRADDKKNMSESRCVAMEDTGKEMSGNCS